jgi:hypothetical protein
MFTWDKTRLMASFFLIAGSEQRLKSVDNWARVGKEGTWFRGAILTSKREIYRNV